MNFPLDQMVSPGSEVWLSLHTWVICTDDVVNTTNSYSCCVWDMFF